MKVSNMRKLLEHLDERGFGNEQLCAEHDEIFLPGPESGDTEGSVSMEALGAHRNEHDGWSVFV